MKKFYKFRTGPPQKFVKMCYVFTGSTTTENYKYVSTHSPSDSDCGDENHIDLNLAFCIHDRIVCFPNPIEGTSSSHRFFVSLFNIGTKSNVKVSNEFLQSIFTWLTQAMAATRDFLPRIAIKDTIRRYFVNLAYPPRMLWNFSIANTFPYVQLLKEHSEFSKNVSKS